MPIDTLENIKTHLGVAGSTDDALLAKLQTAADSFVEDYCRRTFTGGSFTEDHPGGGRLVFLRNYPVSAITSVKVDPDRGFGAETVLAADRYYLHADRGVVESLEGPFVAGGRSGGFPGTVRVAYSTPSDEVPPAVARAYAELVGHWYRQAKTHMATDQLNVIQETDGTAVTEYPWGQSGGFRLPAGVLRLLQAYRVPSQ